MPGLPGHGAVFEEIFSTCLLCGACVAVCPRQIAVCDEVIAARAAFPALYGAHSYEKYLTRTVLAHPEILATLRVLGRVGTELFNRYLPVRSGLRLRLALFRQSEEEGPREEQKELVPEPLPMHSFLSEKSPSEPLAFFPGCTARYLFPEMSTTSGKLTARLGYTLHSPDSLSCCGLAALSAGDTQEARRCARNNIARLEGSHGPILVSCASCYAHLRRYAELFADDPIWQRRAQGVAERLVEFCCFLDQHLPGIPSASAQTEQIFNKKKKKIRVFYHDPCHFRHNLTITQEPRQVLGRLPDCEVLGLADGPECCGQGGLFHIGAPEIAATIRDRLSAKVLALHPDIITSTCSGCLMQWRMATELAGVASRVKVLHLGEVLESLGL